MGFLKMFKRSKAKDDAGGIGKKRKKSKSLKASIDQPEVEEEVELLADEPEDVLVVDGDTSEGDITKSLGDVDLIDDDLEEVEVLDIDEGTSEGDLEEVSLEDITESSQPSEESNEVLNENEDSKAKPVASSNNGDLSKALDDVKHRLDERATEVKETVRGVSSEQNSIIEGIYRLIDQRTMDRAGLNAKRREVWQVLQDSLSGIRDEISGLHENVREVSTNAPPVSLAGVEGMIAEFRADHKSSVERLENTLGELRDDQWKRVESMISELREAEKARVDQVISALQDETDKRVSQSKGDAQQMLDEAKRFADEKIEQVTKEANEKVEQADKKLDLFKREADEKVQLANSQADAKLDALTKETQGKLDQAKESGVMRVFDAIRMGDQRVEAQKKIFRNKIADLEKIYQERVEHLEKVLDERVQSVSRDAELSKEKHDNERKKTLLQMVTFFDTLDHRLRGSVQELVARERNRASQPDDMSVSQERRMGFMKRFLGKRDFERMEAERLNLEGQLQKVDQETIDSLKARVEALEDLRGLLLITLKCEGVEPFSSLGEKYDTSKHVSVDEAPAKPDQEPGTIVSVRRCGYLIDGEVLRPSEVVVASAIKSE